MKKITQKSSDQYGAFEIIKHENHVSSPAVSVLMSVYNGHNYLKESIESILSQTFSNFEFIIVNDGSEDESLDVILDFFQKDRRIVIISQQNIGLTKSLNRGINIAQGKYIARQDADDKSRPDRILKEVEFLEANPDYFMVGTAYEVSDEEKMILNGPDVPLIIDHSQILSAICKFNPFFHSSVIFRNDAAQLGYFYDTRFGYAQDYELWLRVVRHYKVQNLPEKLCTRHFCPEAIGRKKHRQQRKCVVRIKRNLILGYFFDVGFWYYFLKDFAVAFLYM